MKKNKQKNIAGKKYFYFLKKTLVFFGFFPKLNGFFRKSATILMPKSNARAHLKQRKKHSGLRTG